MDKTLALLGTLLASIKGMSPELSSSIVGLVAVLLSTFYTYSTSNFNEVVDPKLLALTLAGAGVNYLYNKLYQYQTPPGKVVVPLATPPGDVASTEVTKG